MSPNLERMIRQERPASYRSSPFFADGRAMRIPPPKTVSADSPRLPPTVREGLAEGRYLDRIPLTINQALLERGHDRFDIYCAACHGLIGNGDSPVADHMTLRRPPSLLSSEVRSYPPGRIYRAVYQGYGLMPSYAHELSVEERWAVVAYVQALELSQRVPIDALPRVLRQRIHETLP